MRRADENDVDALADLQQRTAADAYADIFPPESLPPSTAAVQDRWRRFLGGGAVFAVDAGEVIVGCAHAGRWGDDPAVGLIAGLYVDVGHWGRGLGRSLYDATLGWFSDQGLTEARLWVLEHNLRARAMYERWGWTEAVGVTKLVNDHPAVYDVRYDKSFARR